MSRREQGSFSKQSKERKNRDVANRARPVKQSCRLEGIVGGQQLQDSHNSDNSGEPARETRHAEAQAHIRIESDPDDVHPGPPCGEITVFADKSTSMLSGILQHI
ncbi:hypothetical protein F4811DRAFT_554305 [Daldinia bambusicola]|nr:hypothetical protein F4811DRAFT_554305 [Daldinia bambusicola]